MALRDLVDGECGRVNSLVGLSSHFLQDRSHKEDGLRHQAPYEDTFTNADADQLVQEFLSETLFRPPQTFRMDSLLQEMREMESAASQHAPVQAPGVAASLANNDRDWRQEFVESRKSIEGSHEENIWDSVQEKQFTEPVDVLEFKESVNDDDLFQLDVVDNRPYSLLGRRPMYMNYPHVNYLRELPAIEAVDPLANVAGLEVADEKEVWYDSDADTVVAPEVKSKQTVSNRELFNEDDQEYFPAREDEDMFMSELWSKLSESWQKLLSPDEDLWRSDALDVSEPYGEYRFERENPMKDQPNALEEGKRRLEAGDLSGAVLCFEAAVQVEPKNSEAWELLGVSQSENEQDPQAITALKKCLALDPGNLKALMALAISYTNENYPHHAYHYLKKWLRHNPSYTHLVPESVESDDQILMPHAYNYNMNNEVRELYIAAARLHPKEDIDPDVQCGLGVLFNICRDYDKAVDCFKAALLAKPSDYRMWNRLGATLANGDRSEEAVDAYHHALALAPGYIRARSNVGITCMNLKSYREAVEHFLIALSQQAQAKGVSDTARSAMSTSIWITLRHVLSLADRRDLYDAVEKRDLPRLNQEFGINLKEGAS